MSERELQDAVNTLAQWLGWRIHHAGDSRRSHAGLPDLVAVHRGQGRLLFAELKTERGRLRTEQAAWLEDLRGTPAEVYLWRPSDWLAGTIETVLRGGRGTGSARSQSPVADGVDCSPSLASLSLERTTP